MAGRSASSLFPNLLLVVLGIVVGIIIGVAAIKAPEFLKEGEVHVEETKSSPGPMTHPHEHHNKNFLEDVRFTGSFGSDGWKGAATYTNEHGSKLQLGSKVVGTRVDEIEASAAFKAHDWQWYPNAELKASMQPGKPGLKYAATLSKPVHGGPGPDPTLSAKLTNANLALGAEFKQAVKKGVDVAVEMAVPVQLKSGKADVVVNTKTTYKMGKGSMVGTLGGKASTGMKGVTYGMSYDLGI